MKGGMGNRKRAGSELMGASRSKAGAASHPEKEGCGSRGDAHITAGLAERRRAGRLCLEAPRPPIELRARGLGGPFRTWSSSLRRVMRWKGRIRKDLRERRWQTGSLSSFSRTSWKLLLVFLRGQRAAGEEG